MLTDLSSERGKLGSALMGLELRHNDDDVDGGGEEDHNYHCNHHPHDNSHHIRLCTHGPGPLFLPSRLS